MRDILTRLSGWKKRFITCDEAEQAHQRIDSKTFRQVMREVASPVAIVAAGQPGERSGLTATAICSVSDNPPTVLACLNKNANAHGRIIDSGFFSINFLSSDQEAIAVRFSGANRIYGEDRFALGNWDKGATGAPLLRDSVCNLECQLVGHQTIATHTVFIGELINGQNFINSGALLYQHGAYTQLAPAQPSFAYANCRK